MAKNELGLEGCHKVSTKVSQVFNFAKFKLFAKYF